MANIRMSRINSEIQRAVADIIHNRLNNPDLDGLIISVTYVDTAADLSLAKIGISVLSTDDTRDLVLLHLSKAKSFIRRELAKLVRLRTLPDIEFVKDDSYEKGKKLLDLIEDVAGKSGETDD